MNATETALGRRRESRWSMSLALLLLSERRRQWSRPCRFRAIASSRALVIRSRSLACDRPARME